MNMFRQRTAAANQQQQRQNKENDFFFIKGTSFCFAILP